MTETVPLDDVATALKVHPRTVLRHLADNVNAYWAEGHNPALPVDDVADAFGVTPDLLRRVLSGNDEFLKPRQAADYIDVGYNTFRYRLYQPDIRTTRVVRFARRALVNDHVRNFL